MSSPMYPFILSMWKQRKINAAQVQAYVPFYITQAECDAILATPQGGLDAVEPVTANEQSAADDAQTE